MSEPSLKSALDGVWKMSERLKTAGVHHEIKSYRYDAISIFAHVPGEYWEIDFCENGSIDFEVYKSDGSIKDPAALDAAIQKIEALNEPKGKQCL